MCQKMLTILGSLVHIIGGGGSILRFKEHKNLYFAIA